MAPIILLRTSNSSTDALGDALTLLGYTQTPASTITGYFTRRPSHNEYVEKFFVQLDWALDDDFATLASFYPTAKFILPAAIHPAQASRVRKWVRRTDSASLLEQLEMYQYATSVRNYFHDCGEECRLLETGNGHGERDRDGWVRLCEFLGLGYSIVERKRLRRFPDAATGGPGGSSWRMSFQGSQRKGLNLGV